MADEAAVNELAQVQAGTPAPDAGATAAPAEPVQGEENKQADAPKTYTQEELDKVIAKRLEKAERKAARETERKIAEAVARAIPKQPAQPPAKPKPDQFDTTEAYVEAVAKHAVAVDKAESATSEATTRQQTTQQQRASEIDTAYDEVISRGGDKYEDFDAAMFSVSRVPMSDEVGLALKEAIAESEDGDELLYYLGKHKDEATAIGKMSPARALVALGKIEAKLPAKAPVAKKTSSAPDPISPVNAGSGSTTFTNLDDPKALKALGTTGWINAKREQEAKERQARNR